MRLFPSLLGVCVGGELRIFRENSDEVVEDVPPVRDRLLLFWSDARVPHEVLPSRV